MPLCWVWPKRKELDTVVRIKPRRRVVPAVMPAIASMNLVRRRIPFTAALRLPPTGPAPALGVVTELNRGVEEDRSALDRRSVARRVLVVCSVAGAGAAAWRRLVA
jgi:hypothetical protein